MSQMAADRLVREFGRDDVLTDPVLYHVVSLVREGADTQEVLLQAVKMLAAERRERIRIEIDRARHGVRPIYLTCTHEHGS